MLALSNLTIPSIRAPHEYTGSPDENTLTKAAFPVHLFQNVKHFVVLYNYFNYIIAFFDVF